MYVKVFKRGIGKSGGIDYLLSERTSEKKERNPPAEVLRGNPDLTKSIIDATSYAQKYTSGVLSFAEYDLSVEVKHRIMDSFEKLALFPGLREDQYNILWVQHQDKGRLELHWVVPNQELLSGKRLAPYYHRADMPRVNSWQEVVNYDCNLSSPKEPDRKKTITLNGRLPPLKREAVKQINENIEALVKAGDLQSRMDVLSFLQEAGFEIARVTPRAISIKNPDGGQNLRLKGALYDETFRDLNALGENYPHAQADYQRDLGENITRARERLTEQVQRRSDYLTKRYRIPTPKLQARAERSLERDVEVSEEYFGRDTLSPERSAESVTEKMVGSDRGRILPESVAVPGDMGRKQDDGLSSRKSGENLHRESEGDQMARVDSGTLEQKNMGHPIAGRREREVYRDSPRLSRWLDMREETLHQGWEILRGHYDGIRDTLAERLRAIAEGFKEAGRRFAELLHETSEFFRRTEHPLAEASPGLERSCERTDPSLRSGHGDFGERIRIVKDQKAEELELFQSDINLSEYVATQGYSFDRKESHPNAAMMVNAEGEKLIITRGEGCRWRYFSVEDGNDKGSIVEFVQQRQMASLGRVRQILSPWLESSPVSVPSDAYADFLVPMSKTRQNVLESFYRGCFSQNGHLLEKIGLTTSTIDCERFMGMFREDHQGNILFPHYDAQGLSGYEIKGRDFAGFSENGVKALWESQKKTSDTRLVIVESALNALSYHQMYGDAKTRYISTGGDLSHSQRDLVESAIQEMPADSKVVLGFSNTKKGREWSEAVEMWVLAPVSFERQSPKMGKDWNEELQERMRQEKELQLEQERAREWELRMERERNMTRSRGYGLEM